MLLAAPRHEAVHDFGGFDPRLYAMRYDAPGAPELAARVAGLLVAAGLPVHRSEQGGLDHGIWTALKYVYPHADVPVLPLGFGRRTRLPNCSRSGRRSRRWPTKACSSWAPAASRTTWAASPWPACTANRAARDARERSVSQLVRRAQRDARLGRPVRLPRQAPHAVDMHPSDEHLLPWYMAAGAGGRDAAPLRLHDERDPWLARHGHVCLRRVGRQARRYSRGVIEALPELRTERLVLRASDPALADATADYHRRNREPHARWNPPQAASMFTADGQRERLAASLAAIGAGTMIGWWLFAPGMPDSALGQIHLSQIARAPFCNALLGYSIDAAHEGRGLMREALDAALADAFGARIGLHRVQANVRPENVRSLALLERLGFEREGLAREYLFIDGAWRDHVLTARRAPGWAADRAPPT